jgi:hypothetical protein
MQMRISAVLALTLCVFAWGANHKFKKYDKVAVFANKVRVDGSSRRLTVALATAFFPLDKPLLGKRAHL